MTTSPQTNKNIINEPAESEYRKSGDTKQHTPDKKREIVAIFFAPYRFEIIPLNTQAMAPDPIIRNDNKETVRLIPEYR